MIIRTHSAEARISRRIIWISAGIVCIFGVGIVISKISGRFDTKQKSELSAKPTTGQEATASPKAAGGEQGNATTNSQPQAAAQRSNSPADIAKIIAGLKDTYRPGGLPARIRIQAELDAVWATNPPTALLLTELIKDESAPTEFRLYFAKVAKNYIKSRAFDETALTAALSDVRAVLLGENNQPGIFRAELAVVLTAVDQSDKTINAVAPLLNTTNDDQALRAVSALASTTSTLAQDSLLQFVQQADAPLEQRPKALMAALAPLTSTHPNQIVPILAQVAQKTEDFKTYSAALFCLGRAPSSQAVLEAIASSFDSASRFTTNRARAQQLCRSAAQHHTRFAAENNSALPANLSTRFNRVLQTQE